MQSSTHQQRFSLLLLLLLLLLLQVYQEGTHFMLPWFERPVIFDVRARPSLIQSQSGSRDLQMASVAGGEGGRGGGLLDVVQSVSKV
jgi:hypothetical protein